MNPLFQGTVYFAQIKFHTPSGIFAIRDSNMQTAVAYLTKARQTLMLYANQYGTSNLNVSNQVLSLDVNLSSNSYTDDMVPQWVNEISKQNNNVTEGSCIVITTPFSITNSTFDSSGYHKTMTNGTNIQYVWIKIHEYDDPNQTNTIDDRDWHFATIIGHEIGEMLVDPNDGNPEVCDACDTQCATNTSHVAYYDDNNDFLGCGPHLGAHPSGNTYFVKTMAKSTAVGPDCLTDIDCCYAAPGLHSKSMQLNITINKVDYHDPPNSGTHGIPFLGAGACSQLKSDIQHLQAGHPQPGTQDFIDLEGKTMEYYAHCVSPFTAMESQGVSVSVINPLISTDNPVFTNKVSGSNIGSICNTTLNPPLVLVTLNIQIIISTRGYFFPQPAPVPGLPPPLGNPKNEGPETRTINIQYDTMTKHVTGDVAGNAGDNIHVSQVAGDQTSPEIWFTINSQLI